MDGTGSDGTGSREPRPRGESGFGSLAPEALVRLLESLSAGVVCQDAAGRIVAANAAAREILGLDSDELLGRRVDDPRWRAVDENGADLPAHRHPAMRALASGRPVRGVAMGVHHPGRDELVWLRVDAVPRVPADGGLPDLVTTTFQDIGSERRTRRELGLSREHHRAAIETSPDGFLMIDLEGRILDVNDAYLQRSGYSRRELLATRVSDLNAVETPEGMGRHIRRVLEDGHDLFETYHRTRAGEVWHVEVSVTHWPIEGGRLFIFMRDLRARRRSEELLRTRHRLSALAEHGPVEDLLRATLDEAELYTGSSIGFFHFVDEDQEHLRLTAWSTATQERFCAAEAAGMHYPVSKAGVWAEALRLRRPVVHNDYASLPGRKGMPEGHAEVRRELVVPILREGAVTALLGVGNKPQPYDDRDVDVVATLASLVSDLVARHRAEKARRRERDFAQSLLGALAARVAVLDPQGRIGMVNDAWRRFAESASPGESAALCEGADYLEVCRRAAADGDARAELALEGLLAVMDRRLPGCEQQYPCPGPEGERWFLMRAIPLADPPGSVAVLHEDVTDSRNAERALHRRIDLLALIAAISTELISMPTDEMDGAVQRSIERVGRLCGVDRAYVFLFSDGGRALANTHEWCDDSVEPQKADLQGLPGDSFPWWLGRLAGGGVLEVPRVEELPPEAYAERELLAARGIRSALVSGFSWGGSLRGFVGFDSVRGERSFFEDERHLLAALAGTLGHAFERVEAEATLRDSERRRALALDAAQLGTWSCAPGSGLLELDRRAAAHFGLAADLHSLETLLERVAPESRDLLRSVVGGGAAPAAEIRLVGEAGGPRWIQLDAIGSARRGPAGRQIVGTTLDVTERIRSGLALKRSESRYRELTETTYDWIWEVDADGVYTYASPKVLDLLGHRPEDVVGRRPFEFMTPEEAARVGAVFEDHLRSGRPVHGLLNVNLHADGHEVVLESNALPILSPEGRVLGYRGVDRDVTGRVRAERRLALQAAVSRILAEADGVDAAGPALLEAVCRAEGWEFGALWVEAGADRLRCSSSWSNGSGELHALAERSRATVFQAGDGLPGRAWRAAGPLQVRCDEENCGPRAAAAAAAGACGGVGVPLVHGERALGVLELLWTRGHEPDADQLEVLAGLGRQIGLTLDRQRVREELRRVIAHGPVVLYLLERDGESFRPTWWSDHLIELTGYRREEIDDDWWTSIVHPEDLPRLLESQRELEREDRVVETFRVRTRDRRWLWILDEKRALRDEAGRLAEAIGAWTEITDRIELEDRLRQSQKLEAIGRLAGGVAHDFNNLLTVINGTCEMLLLDEQAEERKGPLQDVFDAGRRAAGLTRQLLAFSRRQMLEPETVDLNRTVGDLQRMLQRLIGEDVALVFDPAPDLPPVRVDPGQLEQAVVNLVVNARDAMAAGGRVTVETRFQRLDEPLPGFDAEFHPGSWVSVAVRDTGSGMSPEVLARVFEPFFTTKELGKGTGLGLSTVFGIVRQSGGQVRVESRPGEGSAFHIYLPALDGTGSATGDGNPETVRGSVLLVDDEASVRDVVSRALEGRGYRVRTATDGAAALRLLEEDPDAFDLLLADAETPARGGRPLAAELERLGNAPRALYMSGYSEDMALRNGLIPEGGALLRKPFTLQELLHRVGGLLER